MSTLYLGDQRFADLEVTLTNPDYIGNGVKWQLWEHGYNLAHADEYGAAQQLSPADMGSGSRYNPNNKQYQGIKRLVGIWRANNARAYHARYLHIPDVRAERTPKWPANGKPRGQVLTPIQLLKTLECLRYNSDDHVDPTLPKIIAAVSRLVIHDLPDYQSARWG